MMLFVKGIGLSIVFFLMEVLICVNHMFSTAMLVIRNTNIKVCGTRVLNYRNQDPSSTLSTENHRCPAALLAN